MSRRVGWRHVVATGILCALPSAACDPGESSQLPPGLDPDQEVVLEEVDPAPSNDFYIWESAYQVEGLPPLNMGHVTAEFLESAARQGADPDDYECLGDASGSGGCAIDEGEPALSGVTFGGPDVEAWSWQFVPDTTVAVRFTDQDGATSWQRPLDRLVIFPDTDDTDGNCPGCRLEAIDADGNVVGSADVETFTYTGG